MAAERS